METKPKSPSLFVRHIALPQDHGSWVFLISPLLIGLFAAGSFTISSLILVIAVFAAFLARQPASIAVKVYSGRRSRAIYRRPASGWLPTAWLDWLPWLCWFCRDTAICSTLSSPAWAYLPGTCI